MSQKVLRDAPVIADYRYLDNSCGACLYAFLFGA